MWHALYPRDVVPANNISYIYLTLGQPEKAVEMAQVALQLSPNRAVVRTATMNPYTCNGEYAEAKSLFEDSVRRKLDAFGIHLLRYSIAGAEDDELEMERQLDWAKGNPRENSMLEEAGSYSAWRGQLKKAHSLYEQAQTLAVKTGANVQAVHILLYKAEADAAFGFKARAQEEVNRALPLLSHANSDQAWAVVMLHQDGDVAHAEKIASDLEGTAPLDLSVHKVYLPTARAAAELKRGNPEGAIAQLQLVEPYDLSIWNDLLSIYLRGAAHQALHHNAEAAAQFEKLLAHQAVVPNSPYITLAYVALARTYVAAGQTDKARAQYEMLARKFSRADGGLPLVLEARKEYARLH